MTSYEFTITLQNVFVFFTVVVGSIGLVSAGMDYESGKYSKSVTCLYCLFFIGVILSVVFL